MVRRGEVDCVTKKREIVEMFITLNLVKFGQIAILYRDNLTTWYCDTFDHGGLFDQAQTLRGNLNKMISAKPLHVTLLRFFKQKGIDLGKVKPVVWLNPHSVDTSHSSGQAVIKEQEIAEAFYNIIMQVHGPKEAPEADQEPPAPAGEPPETETVVN